MKDIKSQVESLLKNYTCMKNDLHVLEYELKCKDSPLNPEVIENTLLAHSCGERLSGTGHSDRTSDIVVDHVDRQRSAEYYVLTIMIRNLRREINRLEHYVALLPSDEADVIRWFYFDNLTWDEIAQRVDVVQRTVERRKKRGIDKLARSYSILNQLESNSGNTQPELSFISCIHKERFTECLELTEKNVNSGIRAMLYIISGMEELWNAGVKTFFDFGAGRVIISEGIISGYSENGAKLLRLAYHFSRNSEEKDMPFDVPRWYFHGLEYPYREIALEALKLALLP